LPQKGQRLTWWLRENLYLQLWHRYFVLLGIGGLGAKLVYKFLRNRRMNRHGCTHRTPCSLPSKDRWLPTPYCPSSFRSVPRAVGLSFSVDARAVSRGETFIPSTVVGCSS
jgi:hypothetical protein